MANDDYDFETDFQLFMRGVRSVHPMNEEIERVYWQRAKHVPEACKHGKTRLTCEICYLNGFQRFERGDAI